MGCCHTFSADGRCITLLKVSALERLCYDCKYCVNRRSNERAGRPSRPGSWPTSPSSSTGATILKGSSSSAVLRSPDYTTEPMIRALSLLRRGYRFNGYIHAKAIPGASPELTEQLGMLADRLSVNIELPSEASLALLAPDKTKADILRPMGQIGDRIQANRPGAGQIPPRAALCPGGQATQMIVGATGESDRHILTLTQALYDTYHLKRVFYSAYIPWWKAAAPRPQGFQPPLLREHRLYQADWLLRFYHFRAGELLDEASRTSTRRWTPSAAGPCATPDRSRWRSTARITNPAAGARHRGGQREAHPCAPGGRALRAEDLKKLGVVLKRAQYFSPAPAEAPQRCGSRSRGAGGT